MERPSEFDFRRLNARTPTATTIISSSGMVIQTYHGILFASRPPVVNSIKGPNTARVIPINAAVRVYELADIALSFSTLS